MFVKKIPGYKADCIAIKRTRDIIDNSRQLEFIIFDVHIRNREREIGKKKGGRRGERERERITNSPKK